MNPHFFAYGGLPIYLTYFVGLIFNFLTNNFTIDLTVKFENAIVILRFFSVLLTIGTVYLIYKIATQIGNKTVGYLALTFSFTSVAFFQYSHFGTFEMWITFFLLVMTYFYILFIKTKIMFYFVVASSAFGLITALKLSSIVFIAIPILVLLTSFISNTKFSKKIITFIKELIFFLYFAAITYILAAPFNFIDAKSFLASMSYEGKVASGLLSVFYTGEFYSTIPVVFPFIKSLPFLINPILVLISIPSFIYFSYVTFKEKNFVNIIFITSFVIALISGSLLFAKWTRYIVPAIPYIYIMAALFLYEVGKNTKNKLTHTFLILLILINLIFSFSFIKTVRINPDTRETTKSWLNSTNIKNEAPILSEVYDLGIVPFNDTYNNISLFNFYDLDNGLSKDELDEVLKTTELIILPSPRIYKTRLGNPDKFPNGYHFYTKLFDGDLGFEKIYETPCDIFCKLTYIGDPVSSVELTTNVFDRPTLYIFKNSEN